MNTPPATVICVFHERVPVTDTTFRYDRIWLSSPEGGGELRTPFPPAVGDTLFLYDRGGTETGPRGQFRVIERDWRHASYGSTYWPVLDQHPSEGPRLTLIVEKADGPFRDEEPAQEDDDA